MLELVSTVSPLPLLAYLDPGSGSMLLQMLIAGLLGGMFAIKQFWHQIKGFVARGVKSDG